MATKKIALGSLVQVDDNDDATFTTVGLTRQITPPGRKRNMVDALALEDTFDVPLPGVEEQSTFEFMQLWHPGDTNHEIIDTLFASKAEVDWRVVYTTAAKHDTFAGQVIDIGPETMEAKNTIGRKVIVQRTGAITRASVA